MKKVRFFDHPDFHEPGAYAKIMSPMPDSEAYFSRRSEHINPLRRYAAMADDLPSYGLPLLSPEQEHHLFRQYNFLKYRAYKERDHGHKKVAARYMAKARSVKDIIGTANGPLAISLASKRWEFRQVATCNDVVSDAHMGLVYAIERFDFRKRGKNGKPMKFSTYAHWCIRGFLANGARERQAQIARSNCEAALRFQYSPHEYFDDRIDLPQIVGDMLKTVPERHRNILIHRYGLCGQEEKTLEEVSAIVGCTKERVRQVQDKILVKLYLRFKGRNLKC